MIDESFITTYITSTFENVKTTFNLGYTFFIYRDDDMLPFATIASTGNKYEQLSRLDRPDVFRLNIGVSRETFQALIGTDKPNISAYDFTALDKFLPHPDYSAQFFICVLSPSEATFERIKPLLAEAYDIAVKKYTQRKTHRKTNIK